MKENYDYLKDLGNVKHVYSDRSNTGLLHEPVDHVIIDFGDDSLVNIAIKHSRLNWLPKDQFYSLYESCIQNSDPGILSRFIRFCSILSMCDMPQRERSFYASVSGNLQMFVPKIYGCYLSDNSIDIAMEDLSYCRNLNCIDNPFLWTMDDCFLAVSNLAIIHKLLSECNINRQFTLSHEVRDFLFEFHDVVSFGCEINVCQKVYQAGKSYIDLLYDIEDAYSKYYRKIHNDFNIRNICINPELNIIKVYDWEFCDIDNPMIDVVDFLISLDPVYLNTNFIYKILKKYYESILDEKTASIITEADIYSLFVIAVKKYSATRMNMYLLCYKRNKLSYIYRMYKNLERLIDICDIIRGKP